MWIWFRYLTIAICYMCSIKWTKNYSRLNRVWFDQICFLKHFHRKFSIYSAQHFWAICMFSSHPEINTHVVYIFWGLIVNWKQRTTTFRPAFIAILLKPTYSRHWLLLFLFRVLLFFFLFMHVFVMAWNIKYNAIFSYKRYIDVKQ